jgi:hypothetical protein
MLPMHNLETLFFGTLTGDQISMMWKMLLERSNGNLKVIFLTVKPMNLWALLYELLPIFSKTQ